MDKILVVDRFRLNVTNRIIRQFNCVGGKGTHVSMNLSDLGVRSRAIGVVMGDVGRTILESLKTMNIDLQFLELSEGNSRINYVLVDGDYNCTLIAEKGRLMNDAIIERLIRHYTSLIGEGDIVVISGDASNQRGTGLQEALMDTAKKKKAYVCLDASGTNLVEGVKKGPLLIKPNVAELEEVYGRPIGSEADIAHAMKGLIPYGIKYIVVSRGSDGSLVYADGLYYNVTAPKVDVKNTVGCGDALLAGLLAGFEQGLDIRENLKRATAVAAAKAMNESTVGFDVGLIPGLEAEVKVRTL